MATPGREKRGFSVAAANAPARRAGGKTERPAGRVLRAGPFLNGGAAGIRPGRATPAYLAIMASGFGVVAVSTGRIG